MHKRLKAFTLFFSVCFLILSAAGSADSRQVFAISVGDWHTDSVKAERAITITSRPLPKNDTPVATHVLYTVDNGINIRSTPNTDSSIIACVPYNTPIECTDVITDGWQQIIYRGSIAYAASVWLGYSNSAPAGKTRDTYEYAGDLVIPDLGINVPMYYARAGSAAQNIVDAPNSACYLTKWDSCGVIVDHSGDGFDGLYYAYPGCRGYIVNLDGTKSGIVCAEVHADGYNARKQIYDNDRVDASTKGYPIVMYTCNLTGYPYSITIVYWRWANDKD